MCDDHSATWHFYYFKADSFIHVQSVTLITYIILQKAFEIFPEKEEVCEVVKTQLRAEHADVGEYLISRSKAGKTKVSSVIE